jgi:hypothetical protein
MMRPVEHELVNTVQIGDDGWAQIAPWGDYRGECITVLPGGKTKSRPAIQRMDRQAGDVMVSRFYSPVARLRRTFRMGLPIFHGHPDQPGRGDQYSDKSPKGLIADLEARADGLYARPVFNNEGQVLLEGISGLAFSPRWTAELVSESDSEFILRPTQLLSAGLTTRPNLPNQAINEQPMDLTKLIAALVAIGITVPDGADLDAVTAAVSTASEAMAKEKTDREAAEKQVANERTELTSLRTEIANVRTELGAERQARAGLLINQAIREGRATEGDRPTILAQFANDFTAAFAALSVRKPAAGLPTTPRHDAAKGASTTHTMLDRQRQVITLINERMAKGETYDAAYAAVKKEKPSLLGLTA